MKREAVRGNSCGLEVPVALCTVSISVCKQKHFCLLCKPDFSTFGLLTFTVSGTMIRCEIVTHCSEGQSFFT